MIAATRLQDVTASPLTLAELGIEKMQSHRWQKVADVQRALSLPANSAGLTPPLPGGMAATSATVAKVSAHNMRDDAMTQRLAHRREQRTAERTTERRPAGESQKFGDRRRAKTLAVPMEGYVRLNGKQITGHDVRPMRCRIRSRPPRPGWEVLLQRMSRRSVAGSLPR